MALPVSCSKCSLKALVWAGGLGTAGPIVRVQKFASDHSPWHTVLYVLASHKCVKLPSKNITLMWSWRTFRTPEGLCYKSSSDTLLQPESWSTPTGICQDLLRWRSVFVGCLGLSPITQKLFQIMSWCNDSMTELQEREEDMLSVQYLFFRLAINLKIT